MKQAGLPSLETPALRRLVECLLEKSNTPVFLFDRSTGDCLAAGGGADGNRLPTPRGNAWDSDQLPFSPLAGGDSQNTEFIEWLRKGGNEPRLWLLEADKQKSVVQLRKQELGPEYDRLVLVRVSDDEEDFIDAFHRISAVANQYVGQEYFESIALQLSAVLECEYALVATKAEGADVSAAETIALVHNGNLLANLSYDVAGTPCEQVIASSACFHCADVQERFPEDTLLIEMGIQSYFGVPMLSRDGNVLGVLVCMHTKPMVATRSMRWVLEIVAARSAAELERIRSEAELKQSHERFHSLFRLAPESVFLLDGESPNRPTIVTANERAAKLYGYEESELRGMCVFDLVASPSDPNRTKRWDAILSGERIVFEIDLRKRDGSAVPVEVTAERVELDGHQYVYCFHRDISERRLVAERLRDSEERLKLATEAASVGIWDWSVDEGRALYSKEWCQQLGYEEHEVTSKHSEFLKRLHPDDFGAWEAATSAAISGREPKQVSELRLRHKDGDYRWIRSIGVPTADDANRMLGCHIDITNHKLREEELRANRQKFETIFRLAPYALFLVEAEGEDSGRIVEANRMAATIHGCEASDLIGLKIFDLCTPHDAALAWKRHEELNEGKRLVFEVEHLRSDGSTVPLEVTASRVELAGHPYIIAFERDISIERQAMRELSVSEERLTLAIDAGGVGIWDWDVTTNHAHLSTEWKRQLGYDDHELASSLSSFMERVHPDDLDDIRQEIDRYLSGASAVYDTKCRLRHRDGSYRWIHTRGTKRMDGSGNVVRMLGCHIDITRTKESNQRLQESEDRWRTLFDDAPIALLLVSLSSETWGQVASANRAACLLHGYEEGEMTGMSIGQIDAYELNDEMRSRLEALKQGQSVTRESEHRKKNGQTFPVECVVSRVTLNGQDYLMGVNRDITERRQLEAARKYQMQVLTAQAEAFPGGIVAYTAEGRRLVNNDRFAEMWAIEDTLLDTNNMPTITGFIASQLASPHVFADRVSLPLLERRGAGSVLLETSDRRVIEHTSAPAVDADGSYFGGICFFSDVTEKTRAQNLLRRRNQVLEELATGHPIASVLTTLMHSIEEALPGMRAVFYASKNDRLQIVTPSTVPQDTPSPPDGAIIGPKGCPCCLAAHQKERVIVENIAASALSGGQGSLHTKTLKECCWAEPVLSAEQEVLGVIALRSTECRAPDEEELEIITSSSHIAEVCLTLTAREKAIRESEELHRVVTETARDAIVTIDRNHRITFANPASSAIFGHGIDELSQLSFKQLVPEADPWRNGSESPPSARYGYSEVETAVGLRADGQQRDLELSYSRHRRHGEDRVTAVIRDISERRAFEKALRRREAELAHTGRVAVLGEALGEIAHEINQPLYAIANFAKASLLEAESGCASIDQFSARMLKIDELARNGNKIIQRTRDFLQKGQEDFQLVSLKAVINGAVEMLSVGDRTAGLKVIHDADSDRLTVAGNEVQLQQVVVNLVKNALEAIPSDHLSDGNPVTIRTSIDGDDVCVSVVDQGEGIPEEKGVSIFDAFQSSKPRGMGMGLSISRTIIESHGGRIWFTSKHGKGSTFHFQLPTGKAQQGATPTPTP